MEYQYLVSAIVSTYNSDQFIRGRLNNLLHQTIGDNLEIIVVNSGSKENEDIIIRTEYLNKYDNIKYIQTLERESIYRAWNRGIKAAKGRFITNANTDDRLREDALEILSNYLMKHSEVALVYADQYVTSVPNAEFDNIKKTTVQRWNNFQHDRLFEGCLTGPQPMWRASLHFENNLWFDENYEVAGDYEFSCNVALKYQLRRIPEILGVYYLSPNSTNKQFQNANKTFIETYKIKSEYSNKYLIQSIESDFYSTYKYYTYWVKRNIFVFTFWKILFKLLNPDQRLPTREFLFWYAARMRRLLGDIIGARDICRKYLKIKQSALVQYELTELLEQVSADPFVSVVIPTYNRSFFLREALTSLTHQTFKNFEVLVINNGSESVDDVINEFNQSLKINILISDIVGSVSRAKNIGIKNARGNYISFLDDDDWYHPDHLKTLVSEIKKGMMIVYSDAYVEYQVNKNGKYETVKKFVEYSKEFSRTLLLVKDYIFTPCIMLSKKCFEIVGLFDEKLKTDEDMDLWIRMSKYYHFYHIKTITCSVRRTNSGSALTKNWELLYKNALYIYKKHHSLSKFNILVWAGQFYYVCMRKNRARKYKNDAFNYNY